MRKYQKRESKTETDSNTTPAQPHRRFTPSSTAMSSNYFAFTQSPSTQMETCSNAAPECHEALWIKPWISVWRQSFKQTCSFFCQKGSCPWPCTILQLCWKATYFLREASLVSQIRYGTCRHQISLTDICPPHLTIPELHNGRAHVWLSLIILSLP